MLQFQADLLGIPVVVPEISETTALGAAYLAGVATGAWSEDDIPGMWKEAARYVPEMGEDRREELMRGWQAAVETTRNHSR
jgi:glycerol kinase